MGRNTEGCKEIQQQILDESTISTYTSILDVRETKTIITFTLKNYSEFEKNLVHNIPFTMHTDQWLLLCEKSGEWLDIILQLNVYNDRMTFAIRNMNSDYKDFNVDCQKYDDRTYSISVSPEKILQHPKYKILEKDRLVTQWMYSARPSEVNFILTPENRSTYDLIETDPDFLCNDLRDVYLSSLFFDFILIFNDREFKVHKLILGCRSDYFNRLLEDNSRHYSDRISHKADTERMHDILLYMYSGRLKDMPVLDMIYVFDIACFLEIKCLMAICKAYFKANFSLKILKPIAFVVINYKLTDLGEAILEFLDDLRKANPRSKKLKNFSRELEDILMDMHGEDVTTSEPPMGISKWASRN